MYASIQRLHEKQISLRLSVIALALVVIVANIVIIDIWLITRPKPFIVKSIQQTSLEANNLSCPKSCTQEIQNATSSGKTISTINQTSTSTHTTSYYLTIGQGQSAASDWTYVPGLQVTIDPLSYGSIKQINFETALRIPTGNETIWVRLYDVTDNYAVWNSEMSMSGGDPQYLTSNPIVLQNGAKTYQVQMKTQLDYPAYLDQSRLHITTY